MAWCLPKNLTNSFLEKLRSGEIDLQKLSSISSSERRQFFAEFLGEDNAREVNALFESKLLLKNQKAGMVRWAKQVSGLTEPARRDLVSRIVRLDKVLDPQEGEQFLNDLANKKLKIDVSEDEAKQIFDLAQDAETKRIKAAKTNFTTMKDNIAYGRAVDDFQNYVRDISPNQINSVQNTLGFIRSLKVIGDLGAPFRQGVGMISHPEWAKSFGNMFRYLVKEDAYKDLRGDILSRPTYDAMKKGGLRLGDLYTNRLTQKEEDYMTTLLGHIPAIRGIERANVGFLYKLRADVFDKFYHAAELSGEDMRDPQTLKDIANVVNIFTDSGNLGKNDRYANLSPLLNNVFFSSRKISATINKLNPQTYLSGSKTARKAAIRNMLGQLVYTGTVLGLAGAAGAKVETDTNSPNFGTISVGKHHIDITGGNASYIVLLSRIITGETTSASGKVTKLGAGYKPETRATLLLNFFRNKLAPAASIFADYLFQTDSENTLRGPFTVQNEIKNLVMPMIIENILDVSKTENDADKQMMIIGSLFDYFGNTYQKY